jgi:D-tyrosyl-tRNA(Tyr) deacylase
VIAVVQRVGEASVTVDGEVVGAIGAGLCVLLGVERADDAGTASAMAAKLAKLRIFADAEGKMNRSVIDIGGGVLIVSQFTLAGDTSGGNRPSFTAAAPPEQAEPLYEQVVATLRPLVTRVATGRFRTHMDVAIQNDGPVTLLVRLP